MAQKPLEEDQKYKHNSETNNPFDLRKPENVTRLYAQKLACDLSRLRSEYESACLSVERNTALLEIAQEGEQAAEQAHETYEVATTVIAEGQAILHELDKPENNGIATEAKESLKKTVNEVITSTIENVKTSQKYSRKTAQIYDSIQSQPNCEPTDFTKSLRETKDSSHITTESLAQVNEALGLMRKAKSELKIEVVSATPPNNKAAYERAKKILETESGFSLSDSESFRNEMRDRVEDARNILQVSVEKRDSAKVNLDHMEAAVEAVMKQQGSQPQNLFKGSAPAIESLRLAQ
ncbi:MAG: hypothetical protein K1X66_04835 [Verrucomicrobiae bacterium]|nr:hypothetical protein [Verrucomicrobiae bacterium]